MEEKRIYEMDMVKQEDKKSCKENTFLPNRIYRRVGVGD